MVEATGIISLNSQNAFRIGVFHPPSEDVKLRLEDMRLAQSQLETLQESVCLQCLMVLTISSCLQKDPRKVNTVKSVNPN